MDRYKYLFKCEMFFPSIWNDDKFILLANEEIADLFALPLITEFESFQSAYQYIRTTKFAEMFKALKDDYIVWKIQRVKGAEKIMECTVTKIGIVENCEITKYFNQYVISERQKELYLLNESATMAETTVKTGDIFKHGDENYFVYVTSVCGGNRHTVIARNPKYSNKIDCEYDIANEDLLFASKVDSCPDIDMNTASEVLKSCPESYLMWRIENQFLKRNVDREDFDRLAYYINLSKRFIDEKNRK